MIAFPFAERLRGSGIVPGEAAQVLAALRHRRLHRRRARDRVPAYLVFGPSGMGKSELLQRSGFGLDRPLDLASSSWWIGEDILFVEVTRQEEGGDSSHPVLPLLRALRPPTPVSGIILVVSPADLTLADATEKADMSAAVGRFLRAFEAKFGYAPPLYIIVSKLDLTPGFTEFFDRLEPAEREQPWGFTLPATLGPAMQRPPRPSSPLPLPSYDDRYGDGARIDGEVRAPAQGDMAEAYRMGFRRLLDTIRGRVTQWISPETDTVQCARIAGFGAQVAALEAILKPIVEPLMPVSNRRWAGAWLRGVYLTSTHQDALSIDALLPDMAKRFGLPRTGTLPPDLGREDEALGYFLSGVFRRVILPEAGLAQQIHPAMRRAMIRTWGLTATVVIACSGLGLVCALSYQNGVARIADVNAAAAILRPEMASNDPSRLPVVLTGLNALEALHRPRSESFLPPVIPLDRYAQALIASGTEDLSTLLRANALAPHLDHLLARDLIRTQASDAALLGALAAARADGPTGEEAYVAWLRDEGIAAQGRQTLIDQGQAALRSGIVPKVDPAYPAFARSILDSRDARR